ncbi:MAG: GrpB family protein [Bryobacterales bacterium]|nr:GrpB family protein [Bryobacterales bacterium]
MGHQDRRTPLSEDYLRTHTIGELKPLSAPILLVAYDPTWPDRFQHEAERIRKALGEQVLRIEHVGSTSVPGLAAKPVIDILLVVADSANETEYVAALEGIGHKLRVREPGWYEHRMFKGPENDVNLHVFSVGCPEIARMLAFRRALRTNEADRELYARSKRALAQQEWKYTQNYADAKAPVIEEIMSRARARGDIVGE